MSNKLKVASLLAMLMAGVYFTNRSFAQTAKETSPSSAAKPAPESKSANSQATGTPELTGTDVGAFLDGLMPSQLQREDIAGATVAVVKDGKVIFAKGYGFSDVDKRTPVTPDTTLFRPGSISKLFTWTSVMQLSEQGKVDLDKDVNEYIDFKIPPAYGKPITLKNIMTHTAGFAYEIWRPEIAQYQSATNTPEITTCANAALTTPLLFDPGDRWEYGISIDWIGKMVETVSGQKLDRYFEDNIFGPLGMRDTAFKISPSQRARLATVIELVA
jgi:CubicO group peptidase (beta-lactamase class C family)